jgi:uncharacterized YccA/Bax inhibitor family protein
MKFIFEMGILAIVFSVMATFSEYLSLLIEYDACHQ